MPCRSDADADADADALTAAERLLRPPSTLGEAVAVLDALIAELAPDPAFHDARDVAALRAVRAQVAGHAS